MTVNVKDRDDIIHRSLLIFFNGIRCRHVLACGKDTPGGMSMIWRWYLPHFIATSRHESLAVKTWDGCFVLFLR